MYARDGEWWEGQLPDGRCGLFPANHVVEWQPDEASTSAANVPLTVGTASAGAGRPGARASEPTPACAQVAQGLPKPDPFAAQPAQAQKQASAGGARKEQSPTSSGGGGGGKGGAGAGEAKSKDAPRGDKPAPVTSPTKFGLYSTYMAYVAAAFGIICGVGDIIWCVRACVGVCVVTRRLAGAGAARTRSTAYSTCSSGCTACEPGALGCMGEG